MSGMGLTFLAIGVRILGDWGMETGGDELWETDGNGCCVRADIALFSVL